MPRRCSTGSVPARWPDRGARAGTARAGSRGGAVVDRADGSGSFGARRAGLLEPSARGPGSRPEAPRADSGAEPPGSGERPQTRMPLPEGPSHGPPHLRPGWGLTPTIREQRDQPGDLGAHLIALVSDEHFPLATPNERLAGAQRLAADRESLGQRVEAELLDRDQLGVAPPTRLTIGCRARAVLDVVTRLADERPPALPQAVEPRPLSRRPLRTGSHLERSVSRHRAQLCRRRGPPGAVGCKDWPSQKTTSRERPGPLAPPTPGARRPPCHPSAAGRE
jgi:hypothetical protein